MSNQAKLEEIESQVKPFDYFFQLSEKLSTLDWDKELFIFGKVLSSRPLSTLFPFTITQRKKWTSYAT